MIVRCAHCHVDLYINDLKMPQGRAKGRCPRCQQVFFIESSRNKPADTQVSPSSLADLPASPPVPAMEGGPRIDLLSDEMVMPHQKAPAGQRLPIPKSRRQFDKGTAVVAIAVVLLLSFLHLVQLATFLGTVLVFVSFGVYLFLSYLSSGRIRIHSHQDVLVYSGGLFAGILIKIFAPM